MNDMNTILFALEIIGTITFAVSGVITAFAKKLDILGAIVLGTATAVGGGILRDITLGYLPPSAFRNPVYAITAIITSVIIFVLAYFLGDNIKLHFGLYSQIINIFDSIGLAVFTVAGVNSAFEHGFGGNAFLTIFVAFLTGVGGGALRDIMAGNVPKILRKRIYALAVIIGAAIYYTLINFNLCPDIPAVIIGAGSVLIIRILATIFHWNLPRIKNLSDLEK